MRVAPVDPSDPDAVALLAALAADMAARYPDQPWIGPSRALEVLWLAWEEEGTAAGCVGMKVLDAGRVEVKHLYVRPEGRGRGAARALMDALEAAAGPRAILLETGPGQPEALALYAGRGYRRLPGPFPGGEVEVPDSIYLERPAYFRTTRTLR